MTCSRLLLALLLVVVLWPAGALAKAKPLPDPSAPGFAKEVMRRIDDLYRGESSHGVMEMRVKTRHWKRTMKMEHWSLGTHYSLVRILKPRKERGTSTLKAKNNLFIYLNKTGRTIKISSGMMGGSWMGSHFTNDDLVRNSRLDRDYTIKLRGKGKQGGQEVYNFMLKARRNAATPWDKLEVTVRVKDLLPVRQVFYDEEGKKMRLLSFSDFRSVGGRTRPGKMTMKPLDKPGELTEMLFSKVDFGVKLKTSFFSLQKLKAL
jgi:outer membrane lipoprotein-sorting protein